MKKLSKSNESIQKRVNKFRMILLFKTKSPVEVRDFSFSPRNGSVKVTLKMAAFCTTVKIVYIRQSRIIAH